jgi:hypothetical protein
VLIAKFGGAREQFRPLLVSLKAALGPPALPVEYAPEIKIFVVEAMFLFEKRESCLCVVADRAVCVAAMRHLDGI